MSDKIDVVKELEALAERIKGDVWPKFTNSGGGIFEYSAKARYRWFSFGARKWSDWYDSCDSAWLNLKEETPITPAEAARLTGTCRNFGMDTGDGVERCDVYTNSEGRLEYAGNDGFFHSLEEALADPDLIAFDYYGNEYGTSTLPRMAGDEGQAAKTPIAVLFVKKG